MSTAVHTFEIPAEASSLPLLRKKLRRVLETADFDDLVIHDLLLCVDEVLANAIRHGYGGRNTGEKVLVSFSDFADRAEILIEDHCPCFDPRKVPAPKLPSEKPGGLGIYLVRSLIDGLHYEALRPQGNRLRLVKYKGRKERNWAR
jgi:anti-sigma regulatory factor (Ser/Thr protein kinase)